MRGVLESQAQSRFPWRFWMLALAYVTATNGVCNTASSAHAEDSLRRRFIKEAPLGWKRLREFSLRLQAHVTEVDEPDFDNPGRNVRKLEFNSAGGNLRYVSTCVEGRVGEQLSLCMNSAYCFKLYRKPGAAELEITYLGMNSKPVTELVERLNDMHIGLMLWLCPIEALVASAGFELTDVVPVTNDAEALVEIQFGAKYAHAPNFRIDGGRIVFDPVHSWALREWDSSENDGALRNRAVVTYDGEISGLPLPRRRTMELLDPETESPYARYVTDFDDVREGAIREDECRLSAFGFPEPGIGQLPGRGRTRLFLVALTGLAFLALAMLMRIRGQRSPRGT